jgi:diguanylate cyclase
MSDTYDFAKKIARKAMPEMIQHSVPPTPENYAVWYMHATGRNKQLSRKMGELLADGVEFTPTLNSQLFETYMADVGQRQEIQRHTFTAQSLMSDLLELMGVVNNETESYNQHLDGFIDDLSGKYQDSGLTKLMKELVERTQNMRDSGGELHEKLADSRKEVQVLRQNLEKITEEANRDPLTGVSNRKSFDTHLAEFIRLAEGGIDFCLLMLDIDHFKNFNDKHGHLVGDEVLKIVARELMNTVKGRDVVARFGGEEFAVLLPTTNLQGALVVAENLRHSIASRDLTHRDTKQNYGTITVSIGAAQYRVGKDTGISLIKRADEALYRSKKGGRNRVTQESFPEQRN